jgi:hypothetical protein
MALSSNHSTEKKKRKKEREWNEELQADPPGSGLVAGGWVMTGGWWDHCPRCSKSGGGEWLARAPRAQCKSNLSGFSVQSAPWREAERI